MEPVTIALTAAALLGGYAAWLEIRNARAAAANATPAAPIQSDYQKQLTTYLAQPATKVTPPATTPSGDSKQALAGVAGITGAGFAGGAAAATAAWSGMAAAAAGFATAAVAHHQAAVLNEAHNLNEAVPIYFQNIDLILKGVIAKELDPVTAKGMVDRSTTIYLETVTNTGPQAGNADQFAGAIQMGKETAALTGIQAVILKPRRAQIIAGLIKKWMATPLRPQSEIMATWTKDNITSGVNPGAIPPYVPSDPTPNPCNGPCVVFRGSILPTSFRAKLAIDSISSGKHGSLTVWQVFGNKYGFSGYPETTWRW